MILDAVFYEMTSEIDVDFEDNNLELNMEFSESQNIFNADFGEVIEVAAEDIPKYIGPYDVIPTFDDQTLNTSGKVMTDNVEVKQIPISVVSNVSGGTTVWIGIGV